MSNETETTYGEDARFIAALRRAGFTPELQLAVTANPAVARRWVAHFKPHVPTLTLQDAEAISVDKLFAGKVNSTAMALKRSGIHTLADLASRMRREVLAVPSVGKYRLAQIERQLAEYGLAFVDSH